MKISLHNSSCRSVVAAAMALMSLGFAGCKPKDGGAGQSGAPAATYPVRQVEVGTAMITNSYPATLRGKLDVDIRPQISGQIVRLAVDEGAHVRAGQLLFVIDPVQYQEAVNAAEAALKVADAAVGLAELTAKNNRELAAGHVIGDYALKSSESNLLSAQARRAQAQAQLATARKNLSFTHITSPTTGVVGSIPLRVGSLVAPTSAQPLTTVSDISEMYAHFSITERQMLDMMQRGGSDSTDIRSSVLSLQLLDGSTYAHTGRIETISGMVDQSTGSISVRALFPNPDQLLRSGSTARVMIQVPVSGVIVVPQKAVFKIQDLNTVYVVDQDQVAHARTVTIHPQDDGVNYIVTSGLKEGETIVVDGVISLRDGMTIQPKAE